MSSLLIAAEMSLLVTLMLYSVENIQYVAKVRITVQFSLKMGQMKRADGT